ncbi:hypothetical protein AB835_04865 [Candidatus Endobugula sertula]|uniref:Sensor protein FixL n=1 Tax=Candidatus Endobugula sertula TaxID=62101 RepID=A0A1D2QRS5_9GAMM|nr:hypothetical protein AB835_04865 [Candidatus Endobugula sertula]
MALQRVTANAQVVLDNAVEAIIRICPQGKVLTFNKSAETMFGYTTKEVLGKSINLLMPTPDREQHDQYIKHYLKTGDKKIIGIDREVLGLRKDGTIFPMELSVSETKIENEHSFTGIIRDISERKDAEEKLRLRDQELQEIRHRIAHMDRLNVMGEMATGIAHELNQPLTAIATYAQASNRLLNNTLKNTNDLSHALMQINEQAQRAGKIIRRLRSIITRQQQVYQRTNINILILETIELTHMDSKIKDITIETQFFTPMPDVELDTIQIQQVLLNLIRNAADAMKHHHETQTKNKKIIIRTVVESHVLRVEVIDNGPGIPSAEKSEIFNPFFTTKNDGMGMGLAICRSILTAHGGELDVNINNKEGTEFYFTLPIHFIN